MKQVKDSTPVFAFFLTAIISFPLLSEASTSDAEDSETQSEPQRATPQSDVANEDEGAQNQPIKNEMSEELQEQIGRGFIYLRSQQNSDGSYGRGRYGRHVGITALAGLAFMADGNLPRRGPYGEQVERALEFVLGNVPETGLLGAETSHGPK